MAFNSSTFLDQLRQMRTQSQLRGRPLSAQEIAGAYSGYAAGASDRVARSRQLGLQEEAADTQKEQFGQNLAFLKEQDATQREIAKQAAQRDMINQVIGAAGTGGIIYSLGRPWGGKAALAKGGGIGTEAGLAGRAELGAGGATLAAPQVVPAATPVAPTLVGGQTGAGVTTGTTGGVLEGGATTGGVVEGGATTGSYAVPIAAAIAAQQIIQHGPDWLAAAMGTKDYPNDVSQNISFVRDPNLVRTLEESKKLWANAAPAFPMGASDLEQYRKEGIKRDQEIYAMVRERLPEIESLVNSGIGVAEGLTRENFNLLKARLDLDPNMQPWIV